MLLGFALVASISLVTGGTTAAWVFALLAALFPVALLGLARPTIGKVVFLVLGILFLAPMVGLLLLGNLPLKSVETRFVGVALLMLIGFWLLPFATTTLLYSRTFSKADLAQGRRSAPSAGAKDL